MRSEEWRVGRVQGGGGNYTSFFSCRPFETRPTTEISVAITSMLFFLQENMV